MEKVFLYHGTSDKIVTPFWADCPKTVIVE